MKLGRTTSLELALAGMLVIAACGSRTGLLVSEEADALADAGADEGADVVDARPPPLDHSAPDAPPPDAPPTHCTSDDQCNDGIACTIDRCDLAASTCTHDPDDARCPPGFRCVLGEGCVATSFANTASLFYGVELPSGSVGVVSSAATVFDDIALRPDGTLFAISTDAELFKVDIKTGNATLVQTIKQDLNALDFGPDGTLYGAGRSSPGVFTIDVPTGQLTQIATLPTGYESSGDLAVIGGTLLLSVLDLEDPEDMEDRLAAIELGTGAVTIVGKTGFACIYGLASYGLELFGFTCSGAVIQIDPTTAASTLLAAPGPSFFGASAR